MKVHSHYLKNVVYLDIESETRIWPATVNFAKGKTVYNERLFTHNNIEYRTWDPYKSKLSACLFEKLSGIPDLANIRTLYLGAATGTTVSHISDIIADNSGLVYALEFSTRAARRLIGLVQNQNRKNIIPIIADARQPGEYADQVMWNVDFIFQDISQVNQGQIFIDNAQAFLKSGSKGLFIVKAASIDSTRPADEVTNEQINLLEKNNFVIDKVLDISSFEREHRAILTTKS